MVGTMTERAREVLVLIQSRSRRKGEYDEIQSEMACRCVVCCDSSAIGCRLGSGIQLVGSHASFLGGGFAGGGCPANGANTVSSHTVSSHTGSRETCPAPALTVACSELRPPPRGDGCAQNPQGSPTLRVSSLLLQGLGFIRRRLVPFGFPRAPRPRWWAAFPMPTSTCPPTDGDGTHRPGDQAHSVKRRRWCVRGFRRDGAALGSATQASCCELTSDECGFPNAIECGRPAGCAFEETRLASAQGSQGSETTFRLTMMCT